MCLSRLMSVVRGWFKLPGTGYKQSRQVQNVVFALCVCIEIATLFQMSFCFMIHVCITLTFRLCEHSYSRNIPRSMNIAECYWYLHSMERCPAFAFIFYEWGSCNSPVCATLLEDLDLPFAALCSSLVIVFFYSHWLIASRWYHCV